MNIPLIRQDPESDDCLRCCALMAFKYFGDSITKEEIWKKLHVYKKGSLFGEGAYYFDLGRVALKRKYQTTIFHYDWHWWDKEVVTSLNKGKEQLIEALKKLQEKKTKLGDKGLILKEMSYFEDGGLLKFVFPKLELIDDYLKQEVPTILSVQGQDFYHDPKEDYVHAILIVGKKDGNYIVRDPLYGLEEISSHELSYAWVKTGGWMMVIDPPRGTK